METIQEIVKSYKKYVTRRKKQSRNDNRKYKPFKHVHFSASPTTVAFDFERFVSSIKTVSGPIGITVVKPTYISK